MRLYVSTRDFARIVKCDPKTVISWIEHGWIPGARRLGHRYQIPVKEIDVYRTSTHYPPLKWQK